VSAAFTRACDELRLKICIFTICDTKLPAVSLRLGSRSRRWHW
jgi:hypothetical protein